ncbi:DNA double-strand break repair protein Mre11 [Haloplanus aerogenes]|uniref:DNA double-strand break repair protein Mre11 n=1 Tax=Haloplanus aerogenes TaxID=660522 RepID=A0A3M0CXV1_9EURY|nr:DNA double-strand break repair protein Mre11 [Haloplanus aerogenes]RMB13932.1 DNA repair exonuclease SbcCD nuclease subunit [Haloplanus aerogenes]
MTRVIHTGDTHVGYRQYHSPERRQDFLDAFEAVVDDAVEQRSTGSRTESDDAVDALVHAGDLFHDRRPDLPDLLGVLSALRRLDAADVPFLAIVGNHEATRGSQWLDLFENLGLATRLGAEPTVVGDTAFYGLDHVPRSRRDDLDYDFASPPDDVGATALVAHGLFTPFAHADWDTEELLDAASVDFDAVLLGDNHVPDTAQVEGTWVTYCGSTERASADERDARGYNLVEFGPDASGDATVDIRRRSLDTRPFAFVDVELAEGEGVERVRERVREHDLSDAVAVVTITGDGDPVTPAAIEDAAVEAGALLARVTDHRAVGGDTVDDVPAVDFADPDAAVRERVREMDLSSLGRRLDETVRDDAVADSNVRERVASAVGDAVADDALDGLSTVDGGDAEDSDDADKQSVDDGRATDTEPETDVEADTDADEQVSMEDYL